MGYLNLRPEQTNTFFKLMEERYRQHPTIITTNLDYTEWGNFLGNKALVDALLSRLRHLRSDLARRRRTKPFRIFQNRTLEVLAEERPTSREALLEVYGLGPAKVTRYGDQLLEVIRQAAEVEQQA